MNKKIFIFIVIALIVIVGVGIIFLNKNNKNIQINTKDLASKIIEAGVFEDELVEVNSEMIMSDYNFTADEVEEFVSYQGSGATSEEIVILKVKEKSNLNNIKNKIEDRLEERKEAFESYLPEEVGKIDNKVFRVEGNYVILCISNDTNKVNTLINDYVK